MLSLFVGIPILNGFYTFLISKYYGWKLYGKLFFILFPFLLWSTMRLCEDSTAHARSTYTLIKMSFLYNKSKK